MRNALLSAAMVAATVVLISVSTAAAAPGPKPFDASVFKAAQTAGQPIIVEIHADWCAECKAQNRVLDKLGSEPRYSSLVRLRVDYDSQKDLVKAFEARRQSTLIVYKGDQELARAVGITAEDKIRALIDKAF